MLTIGSRLENNGTVGWEEKGWDSYYGYINQMRIGGTGLKLTKVVLKQKSQSIKDLITILKFMCPVAEL